MTQTDVSVERDVTRGAVPSLHLERGASVGRYVILDVVGEGGMGIVYAAYDPELDRKLALKLLRTASSERRAERRRLRLIREAQAMARLSHANVITVHDVGTIDDQVFVAMEFIEGCSLAEWIRMDHDWRRVVDVFVQAGEGLAAAHAAGLVHRDFKPDNVMLTGEHRAVVTDFGLARAAGRREASQSRDPEGVAGPSRASLSTTVTAAGAIMGTPAYMSPEQHEGREVDARSDQFAFAVALYEALFGVRPFPGDDVASLAYNVGAGNIRPAPARSPVPSWIRQVLLRALSVEPSERYPSMVELLEALQRERSGRLPWPWLALGVATVLGGAFAGGAWLRGGAPGAVVAAGVAESGGTSADPCATAEYRLTAALGPEARDPVQRVFLDAPLPFAPEVWTAVDAAVTRWEAAWRTTHGAVCREAAGRGEPVSAGVGACLDGRLADIDAQLEVLASGDPRALERALDAITGLPSPERCGTASGSAPRSKHLDETIAKVGALQRVGLTEDGLQAARALAEQAGSVGDDGLQAEARYRLAALQRSASRLDLAEFNDRDAVGLALRAGNDAVAAAAAVALVEMIGADPSRTREAESWVGLAEALQDRASVSEQERAALLVAQAQLLEVSGRADAAWRPLRRAADLLEDAYGDEDVRVADVWTRLGRHALRGREVETARTSFERARSVIEASFGPLHPRTATLMRCLGEVSLLEGDLDGAAEELDAALSVLQLYPANALRAETMLSRATVDLARGDLDAAEEMLVIVAALHDVPAAVADRARVELVRLALRRGDVDSALLEIAAGRGRLSEGADPSPLDAVQADALARQGKVSAAEDLLDATIEALEQQDGDTSAALAEPLTVRGELLLSRMFPARALGDLERALALRSGLDAYGTARTEFALAQALVVVDPESTRALELARDAFARLDPGEPLYAAVQQWLTNR